MEYSKPIRGCVKSGDNIVGSGATVNTSEISSQFQGHERPSQVGLVPSGEAEKTF